MFMHRTILLTFVGRVRRRNRLPRAQEAEERPKADSKLVEHDEFHSSFDRKLVAIPRRKV